MKTVKDIYIIVFAAFILISCIDEKNLPSYQNEKVKLTLGSINLEDVSTDLDVNKISVTAVIDGVNKNFLISENTKGIIIESVDRNITELKGFEQLKNVKYLYLDNINSRFSKVEDYLYEFPDIEILHLENCYLNDLSLLRNFKKLKCLLIYNSEIMKSSVIDFSENSALEYFALVRTDLPPEIVRKNVRYKMQDHLQIKNIPRSLQVMNFAETRAIIFDDDFFKSIMSVKKVYIMNSLYTADFWNRISEDGVEFKKFQLYYVSTSIPDKYPNVVRVNNEKDGEVDLPDFLKRDNLAKLELPEIY